jgi:hypothetical protein
MPREWAVLARWALRAEAMPRRRNDQAAALGQPGQPGDVLRAGRSGQLVGVVLNGRGGGQVGIAGGQEDGDPRG